MSQRTAGDITYHLIRARQKRMTLRVDTDGIPVVRIPWAVPAAEADRFVADRRQWILEKKKEREFMNSCRRNYTEQEKRVGRKRAAEIFEKKCSYYAARMGVSYNRITIREQKTRWGSCSSLGNLNFNWKTALMPEAVQDYLTVHELAHLKEMNHSVRFWKLVEEELPDYRERRAWLKIHGMEY